uniref:DNA-directed RNA polymerase subunit n=1 Tax=Eptatretus burgeri TaxID=7764 RepID=A0A8C4R840_EPTBU
MNTPALFFFIILLLLSTVFMPMFPPLPHRFSGALMAYGNIKLVKGCGDILDDQGVVHMDIQADFVIFNPKCDDKLMGTVNKVSSSHVGCLVHNCFNVSLAWPSQAWHGKELHLGDEVLFKVLRLDSDQAGVLLVCGSLLADRFALCVLALLLVLGISDNYHEDICFFAVKGRTSFHYSNKWVK